MKAISKITFAIGVLCLFALAQTEKPKAAVYIKGNPEGRDALRMAVNTFLIKSQKYQMIAVDAIDVVAKEQNRQRSGSVSNEDIAELGRDAGAQYVCVVEKSESDGISYVSTSMVSVQSKIAELSEMSELPRGGRIINLIEKQINTMLGIGTPEPEFVPEPSPPRKAELSYPVEQSYSINSYYDDNLDTWQSEDYDAKPISTGIDATTITTGVILGGALAGSGIYYANKGDYKSMGYGFMLSGIVFLGTYIMANNPVGK